MSPRKQIPTHTLKANLDVWKIKYWLTLHLQQTNGAWFPVCFLNPGFPFFSVFQLSSLAHSHVLSSSSTPVPHLFWGSIFWRTAAWCCYNVSGYGGTQLPAFYTVTHLADCSSLYSQQWFHNKHKRNVSNHVNIVTLISIFLLAVVALGVLSLSLGLPCPCSDILCI